MKTRNPKPEIRKKFEIRNPKQKPARAAPQYSQKKFALTGSQSPFRTKSIGGKVFSSDFGFRPSFGFRISGFGFLMVSDFRR